MIQDYQKKFDQTQINQQQPQNYFDFYSNDNDQLTTQTYQLQNKQISFAQQQDSKQNPRLLTSKITNQLLSTQDALFKDQQSSAISFNQYLSEEKSIQSYQDASQMQDTCCQQDTTQQNIYYETSKSDTFDYYNFGSILNKYSEIQREQDIFERVSEMFNQTHLWENIFEPYFKDISIEDQERKTNSNFYKQTHISDENTSIKPIESKNSESHETSPEQVLLDLDSYTKETQNTSPIQEPIQNDTSSPQIEEANNSSQNEEQTKKLSPQKKPQNQTYKGMFQRFCAVLHSYPMKKSYQAHIVSQIVKAANNINETQNQGIKELAILSKSGESKDSEEFIKYLLRKLKSCKNEQYKLEGDISNHKDAIKAAKRVEILVRKQIHQNKI